jgi:NAD(P)-dependent dehydrogenase (short-subunit alcohol dehydrogenase family)
MGVLDGKAAIVTGSARGIGRATAELLSEHGARVLVNDLDADVAEHAANEIEGETAVFAGDLTAEGAPEALVQAAVDAFGQIDIVVNNAGIVRDRTLVKMDESDFDSVIATHLKGTFNVVRHAAPHMKEQGWGRVVNITSSAGLRGNFGQTNYAAAKAGIMGMTFVWALELGKYGICVNAVAPAGVTRMTGSLAGEEEVPPQLDPALNAPLVVFLSSDAAAGVNGQILGRTDFSYSLFQHPKQVAWMHRDGGWDVEGVVDEFDGTLGQHLQQVGMVMPKGLSQDTARK